MNYQKQIILSIGTNIGNRHQNTERAIAEIHKTLGTVIKISGLYETPSWGFDSEAFYNCVVLVHSNKNPEEILEEILNIEIKLGRERSDYSGYKARVIDIDIVAINNEIVDCQGLKIPHPYMQDRKFVLQPMLDLNIDWEHPVLLKKTTELLSICNDKSECKFVCDLEHPLERIQLKKYNYIAIEGAIGVGKTTLSTKISEDFNATIILERFADNPFLPKFYKDPTRFAFSLEMSFLADRYQQLSDDLEQLNLFTDFVIADYHIFKSLIFAKITLAEDEFRLYKKLFDIIYKDIKKPELYIYLYQNPERLLENIKKRGRSYEQDITKEYLKKINEGYLDYIKKQRFLNILIIDVSDMNFVTNQEDYIFILNQIQQNILAK